MVRFTLFQVFLICVTGNGKPLQKVALTSAISSFADTVEGEEKVYILDRTFGAWRRQESAAQTVRHARASKHFPSRAS